MMQTICFFISFVCLEIWLICTEIRLQRLNAYNKFLLDPVAYIDAKTCVLEMLKKAEEDDGH